MAISEAQAAQTFENLSTGRCLDDSEYGLRSFPCNGLNYQRWTVTGARSQLLIMNRQTGRCLDNSRSFGLRTFGCNNDPRFQQWQAPRFSDGSINLMTRLPTEGSTSVACATDFAGSVRAAGCILGDFRNRWR